ncbi:MAG: hypothetical protein WC479_10485 [Candidatus Izemoplasmatales bacterium]
MELVEGNKYKLTFKNGNSGIFTYTGIYSGSNYRCDACSKDRWETHWFLLGDVNNPTSSQKYGTECIKHINIEAA